MADIQFYQNCISRKNKLGRCIHSFINLNFQCTFQFFNKQTGTLLLISKGNTDMITISTICRTAYNSCSNCLVKRNKSHFKALNAAVLFFGLNVVSQQKFHLSSEQEN